MELISPERALGVGGALRFRRDLIRVLELPGHRAQYEFVWQIARETGDIETVLRLTADYATLDPTILTAVGGDRFPPSIFAVPA